MASSTASTASAIQLPQDIVFDLELPSSYEKERISYNFELKVTMIARKILLTPKFREFQRTGQNGEAILRREIVYYSTAENTYDYEFEMDSEDAFMLFSSMEPKSEDSPSGEARREISNDLGDLQRMFDELIARDCAASDVTLEVSLKGKESDLSAKLAEEISSTSWSSPSIDGQIQEAKEGVKRRLNS